MNLELPRYAVQKIEIVENNLYSVLLPNMDIASKVNIWLPTERKP